MKKQITAALCAGMLALVYLPVSADMADSAMLLEFLRGDGKLTAQQASALDGNQDGRLDARDLTLLLRAEAGQNVPDAGLLWQDEFDGDALDMQNWSYELGNWKLDASGNYVTGGWGNDEQEFYTDRNASVHDGILTIAARKETYTDAVQGTYEYTSARLSTQHKFSVCGGRIEVRARCDSGKSLWPAIWMLPETDAYGGWAASGEIDIMEGWGSTPEKICGTIHYGGSWPNNQYQTENYLFPAGDSTEQWHTYAVEWERSEMRWYVDNILYSTKTDWYSDGFGQGAPFDQNFYILLNLAVGGKFDGVDGAGAEPSIFAAGEKHFDIDYVRVYDNGMQFSPTEMQSQPLEAYIEGAEAILTNRTGKTEITVSNVGELEYAVMGLLRGQDVHGGATYEFRFAASSTVPREMLVTAEDSAYHRYLEETVMLTAEPQEYSFTVTIPEELNKMDCKFQLGNLGDAASIGEHTVTLSHIFFSEVRSRV